MCLTAVRQLSAFLLDTTKLATPDVTRKREKLPPTCLTFYERELCLVPCIVYWSLTVNCRMLTVWDAQNELASVNRVMGYHKLGDLFNQGSIRDVRCVTFYKIFTIYCWYCWFSSVRFRRICARTVLRVDSSIPCAWHRHCGRPRPHRIAARSAYFWISRTKNNRRSTLCWSPSHVSACYHCCCRCACKCPGCRCNRRCRLRY